jgi:hypothetical protein
MPGWSSVIAIAAVQPGEAGGRPGITAAWWLGSKWGGGRPPGCCAARGPRRSRPRPAARGAGGDPEAPALRGNPQHRRDAGLGPARAPPTCPTGRHKHRAVGGCWQGLVAPLAAWPRPGGRGPKGDLSGNR